LSSNPKRRKLKIRSGDWSWCMCTLLI
jgi:hypothetical protein